MNVILIIAGIFLCASVALGTMKEHLYWLSGDIMRIYFDLVNPVIFVKSVIVVVIASSWLAFVRFS